MSTPRLSRDERYDLEADSDVQGYDFEAFIYQPEPEFYETEQFTAEHDSLFRACCTGSHIPKVIIHIR
jgi:hypothetical protein